MQNNNLPSMNVMLVKGSILLCLFLGFIVSLYSDYQSRRTTAFDRLNVVAEMASDSISDPLRHGMIKTVAEELEYFSKRFSIGVIELYGVDGNLLATSGVEKDKKLQSLILKKYQSRGWPFSPTFQYSHFVLSGKKPLGILVLFSADSNKMPIRWPSYVLVAIACLAAMMIFLLPTLKKGNQQVTSAKGSKGSDNPLQYDKSPPYYATGVVDAEGKQSYIRDELEKMVLVRTADLIEERDRALSSAQAKSDFLASMSHEIRTPLNGIIGVLSLLQKSVMRSDNKRLLNVAVRSADSLLLIISDILDFSKIEAGIIDFEKIPFDLREIVEESLALYSDSANAKGIELLCYMPLDIPFRLLGDPTRLRQVLTNLVNNAVKFTDIGEVSLQVEILEAHEERQLLRFSVEDTGIGIAAKKIDRLFEMFTQGDISTTRIYGGTGIGLSVCKKLVELQKGELGVQSKPGSGTTFWFTMEFEIESKELPVLPCDEINGKRIAIFDRCETNRTILDQYLKGCSLESRVVSGDGEILIHLQELQSEGFIPDILLVDYHLIIGTTKVFFQELLNSFTKDMPQIFLLTRDRGLREKLVSEGATGVIHKPVRLHRFFEQLSGKISPVTKESENIDSKDFLSGTVLLVDDEPINQRVETAILEKVGLQVETASNGIGAVEKTSIKKYDLVLLDIQMPEMSGFEAAEIIREREKETGAEHQIIIAVTANTLQTTREHCLAVGIDDFIAKPIKPEQLIARLRPWLGKAAISKMSDASVYNDANKIEDIERYSNTIWDRHLALEYVGGDEALLQDLIDLFLQRMERLILPVKEAIAANDSARISETAHALKGAVNHFAAKRAQQLSKAIEDDARLGKLEGLGGLFNLLEEAVEQLEQELKKQLS